MTEKVPSGLAAGGQKLWREIAEGHPLRPDHRRILLDACHEADFIDRLQSDLASAPTTTKGSMGQLVAHPVPSQLKEHRMALNTLLRSLALATTDTSAADARTAAREGATALARARWARKPA